VLAPRHALARISAVVRPGQGWTLDRPGSPPARATTSHRSPSLRMYTSRRPRGFRLPFHQWRSTFTVRPYSGRPRLERCPRTMHARRECYLIVVSTGGGGALRAHRGAGTTPVVAGGHDDGERGENPIPVFESAPSMVGATASALSTTSNETSGAMRCHAAGTVPTSYVAAVRRRRTDPERFPQRRPGTPGLQHGQDRRETARSSSRCCPEQPVW
jgi:hypothetical protein